MADMGDKARDEFFSEAHEIIEALSRDLLQLDAARDKGPAEPELVNNIFRAVHTLKGLAGLFGAARMIALSHELENVLDDLRLGKIERTQSVPALLFRGVNIYGRILAVEKGVRTDPLEDIDQFLRELGELSEVGGGEVEPPSAYYELDPGLLAVLTEYEEHRLRTNIEQGQSLFRLRVRFELATIDDALNSLKLRAKPHGEIITYLPTGEGADADSIELDILMASQARIDVLRSLLGDDRTKIEEVPRRSTSGAKEHVIIASAPLTPAPDDHRPSSRAPAPDPRALAERRSGIPRAPGTGAMAPEVSLRSVTQTVRVDIRKLDLLMNIVGELSIVRNAIGRLTDTVRKSPEMREIGVELYRLHRGFERHLADLQSGILEVRMVPLGQLFDKLARVVRQISREADKEVNLVITGAETEVDKLIVEELSGRGVGMDVVKTNISKLGGIIDIYSEMGIGTKFTVTLPITLAIISALIVHVEGRTFAIPLSSVQEAIWLDSGALRSVEGQEMMTLRGSTLPLCRIKELFGLVT